MTSSLAREADVIIGMNCGPEIGVAATKSFTSQLVILYKIVQKLSNDEITINFGMEPFEFDLSTYWKIRSTSL